MCSFFNVFSVFPDTPSEFNGSASMILKATGALLSFLLLLPAYLLLRRHPGQGLLECAYSLTGGFGRVIAVIYYVFFMSMGVNTITGVEFFLTSTVYNFDSKPLILLLFSLLLLYASFCGIEPLGRLAVVISVLFLTAAALLVIFLSPQFDLNHFYSPLYDGVEPYIKKLPVIVSQNNIFIPMLLLVPFLNKRRCAACFAAANGVHLAVAEALMFASSAVLGDYTPNNLFSMYTLVTMVNTSRLHRVDSIHIGIWVLLSFIRTAVIILCACLCLKSALPPVLHRFAAPFTVLLFFAGGYIFSHTYSLLVAIFKFSYSGLPTLLTGLLLPSTLLTISLIKEKNHGKSKTSG